MPDDDKIINMDPVQYVWMYHSWLKDQDEEGELYKNQACLIGSFWDQDRAARILDNGAGTHMSNEDEFEESSNIVKSGMKFDGVGFSSDDKKKRKRRRLRK